jgi:glutathione S-transferase
VPFEQRWVDLSDKPEWFKAISPLGKTPVLLVDGVAVCESAVICEYLDEVYAPRVHPAAPLQRARHRAWMEFGSAVLSAIAAFYNAPDAASFDARRHELRARFAQVEEVLSDSGPWFAGETFSMVDAVFAPVFRYFDVFESLGMEGFFDALPKLRAWRSELAARESVRKAARSEYAQLLTRFLLDCSSEISRRVAVAVLA